jgi:hypothetical protein
MKTDAEDLSDVELTEVAIVHGGSRNARTVQAPSRAQIELGGARSVPHR